MKMIDKIKKEFENVRKEMDFKGPILFTKSPKNWDFSTNLPLMVHKSLNMKPYDAAKHIMDLFNHDFVSKYEIAGPGFINICLKDDVFYEGLESILEEKDNFGRANLDRYINIEYVSANPTGFLHVGHARNAIVGSSLANILRFLGNRVDEEFYVNDAGAQIEKLGVSVYVRYMNLFNKGLVLPEDSYKGKDIILCAQNIKEKYDQKFVKPYEEIANELKEVAKEFFLTNIKNHLKLLGVEMDFYFFESNVLKGNIFKETFDKADKHIYKKDGAIWLRTTELGDDKDRVLIKSDGVNTYFAPDFAYHNLKISRGYDEIIDVWGADHSGYMKRMKCAVEFLGIPKEKFNILGIEMVKLIQDGKELKMSKRLGTAFTLKELVKLVGKDATNFFLLNRSFQSKLDFDLNLASEHSTSNPVFTIQYTYARCSRILQKTSIVNYNYKNLILESKEKEIIIKLLEFPSLLLVIERNQKINLLCQYLINLSNQYNSIYSNSKIIDSPREQILLAITKAVKIVIKNCLNLLNISQPEKM